MTGSVMAKPLIDFTYIPIEVLSRCRGAKYTLLRITVTVRGNSFMKRGKIP
jgi:hypothetical protein